MNHGRFAVVSEHRGLLPGDTVLVRPDGRIEIEERADLAPVAQRWIARTFAGHGSRYLFGLRSRAACEAWQKTINAIQDEAVLEAFEEAGTFMVNA